MPRPNSSPHGGQGTERRAQRSSMTTRLLLNLLQFAGLLPFPQGSGDRMEREQQPEHAELIVVQLPVSGSISRSHPSECERSSSGVSCSKYFMPVMFCSSFFRFPVVMHLTSGARGGGGGMGQRSLPQIWLDRQPPSLSTRGPVAAVVYQQVRDKKIAGQEDPPLNTSSCHPILLSFWPQPNTTVLAWSPAGLVGEGGLSAARSVPARPEPAGCPVAERRSAGRAAGLRSGSVRTRKAVRCAAS